MALAAVINRNCWIEVGSGDGARARHASLLRALAAAGAPREGRFVDAADPAAVVAAILAAKAEGSARSIRFGDEFGEELTRDSVEYPAQMLSLRACDALDFDGARWWPRSWLFEGVLRAVAHDVQAIDFERSALVIGCGPKARAAVAALTKIGFNKFNLLDRNDGASRAFAAELSKSFFRATFASAPKLSVSQLPSSHAVVVNAAPVATTELGVELMHMNFLSPGAWWIELVPGDHEAPLLVEARGAGARVLPARNVIARADGAWAEATWGARIDVEAHASRL